MTWTSSSTSEAVWRARLWNGLRTISDRPTTGVGRDDVESPASVDVLTSDKRGTSAVLAARTMSTLSVPMLDLLARALYGPRRPPNPAGIRGLVNSVGIPSVHFDPAYRLAAAAVAINNMAGPRRADVRGAVAEAVAEGIRSLTANVDAEVACRCANAAAISGE